MSLFAAVAALACTSGLMAEELTVTASKDTAIMDNGPAAKEDFAKTELGKALRKMEILDGRRFTKHEFENPPEYFILYFSASW